MEVRKVIKTVITGWNYYASWGCSPWLAVFQLTLSPSLTAEEMVFCCMGWLSWKRTKVKSPLGAIRSRLGERQAGFPQMPVKPPNSPLPSGHLPLHPHFSALRWSLPWPRSHRHLFLSSLLVFTLWAPSMTSERKRLFIKEPSISTHGRQRNFSSFILQFLHQLPISFSGPKRGCRLWNPNETPKHLLGTSFWK